MTTETSVVYQALAERTTPAARGSSELTPQKLRQRFSAGHGLIWTPTGWRPPADVLRGSPVFGPYRQFVPQIPGSDALWRALQVRSPHLDDCVNVLRDIAKDSDHADTQAIVLDTLRLMVTLLEAEPATSRQARRLQRTPLRTTQGWTSRRPVLAVDDPSLVSGIGDQLPLWTPGGDLTQFASLFAPLRLHEVTDAHTRVVDAEDSYADDESTVLFHDAACLLREDLARNDPASQAALRLDWRHFIDFEVRVCPELRVRVDALPDTTPLTIPVSARIDRDARVMYVASPETVSRADGGGRAIANLFDADRRRLAQAWLAAVEVARQGRAAVALRLSTERAKEESAANQAAITAKLAAIQHQAQQRHARKPERQKQGGQEGRGTPPSAGHPDTGDRISGGATKPQPQRVLVNPSTLVVVDPKGTIVSGTQQRPGRGKRSHPSGLPNPTPGGDAPRERSAQRAYTDLEKETLGLHLVREVLGSDAQDMIDLRAQHGVGADAVDELRQFYELKVSAGAEPDYVDLQDTQIRRAMSIEDFFLVVVSNLEGENAKPRVRVMVDPLAQLRVAETSQVRFSGVQQSQSLVYDLRPQKDMDL